MTRARDLAAFVSNADGDIKFDTDTLFIDSSANSIGIGNTAPSRPLHITANPAMIMLEDSDGGSDDKKAQIQVDTGAFEINARNDDDSSRTDNILVADLGTGHIGVGINTPSSMLHLFDGGTDTGITLQSKVQASATSSITFMSRDSSNVNQNAVLKNIDGRLQSSAGIMFGSDTAAANALNDYEEGEHEVTLTPSGSGSISVSGSNNDVSYTKTGNRVHVTGQVLCTGSSSPTGYIKFSLPFPIKSSGTANTLRRVGGHVVIRYTSLNVNQYELLGIEGESHIRIYRADSTDLLSTSANQFSSIPGTGISILVNFTYPTDS